MDNKNQTTEPYQPLPLILASQSPRRKELLTEAGYTFAVCAPDDSVEKGVCSKCSPDQLVVDSAVAKAAAIASQTTEQGTNEPAIILAADTVGVCKAEVLGKPVDADHAEQMLQLMSGTVQTFLEKTTVEMDVLSDEMIAEYLDTDLWIGKAGAFGFQDGLDWGRIVEGLASTVVGLPIERLPQWIEALQEKVA